MARFRKNMAGWRVQIASYSLAQNDKKEWVKASGLQEYNTMRIAVSIFLLMKKGARL